MADKTQNYALTKFTPGQPNWGDAMDANLDAIDTALRSNSAAITAESERAQSAESANTSAIAACEKTANKGAANGYPDLDSTGHVPINQIPMALQSAVYFAGLWNASTNTPTLTSGQGYLGQCYKVSVAGSTSVDGNSVWHVGDWVVYDGSVWDKIDNFEAVTSVQGRVGAVTITPADLGLAPVATSGAYSDLAGKPTLATVAASGSYSDLLGKPILAASATTDTTNASNITSGTLPDARLSSNVPLLNANGALSVVRIGSTDAGLSRLNTGVIAVGNGTQSDVSGTVKAAMLTLVNSVNTSKSASLYCDGNGWFVLPSQTCWQTYLGAGNGTVSLDSANGLDLGSSRGVVWGPNTTNGSFDTNLSRLGPGNVAVGNGTVGNSSGLLSCAGVFYQNLASGPSASQYFEDFYTQGAVGQTPCGSASGYAGYCVSSPDNNHQGCYNITSGTVANTGYDIYNSNGFNTPAGKAWTFETCIYLPTTIANERFFTGICSTQATVTGPTNGFVFMYDSSVGSNWMYRVNGTNYTTSVACAANTWYRLTITRDASNNVTMYINGVSVGTFSNSDTGARMCATLITLEAVSKQAWIDYWLFQVSGLVR